ncbi:ComF family protein [Streptomyces sp. JB150]|uniref:ComF family protein n=1 Tax=Streptomyces sp. JB150 TaxID=2714844 RepID=UPI001F0DD82F|nr:ComF family protein [Streptomyces sp. JB150]
MRGWWRDLTDLVLPADCGGCGRPRTVLCPECRAVLSGAAPCRVRPVPEPPGLPAVHAAARYGDEVRAVLLAHKERGALALSGPLGAALAGAVRAGLRAAWGNGDERGVVRGGGVDGRASDGRACDSRAEDGRAGDGRAEDGRVADGRVAGGMRSWGPGAPVLLVPVPSARRAVRARGHDPVRRIAYAAAGELRRTGTPARVAAVVRQRRTVADQSGLNARQRLDNLAGALAVAPGGERLLAGGPVVLVDDLMTTGASLTEAARAVREAMSAREARSAHAMSVTAARRAGGGAGGRVRQLDGAPRERVSVVYGSGTRERTGARTTGPREGGAERKRGPGMPGPNGAGEVICAAVIAATPDSFAINRN